jgi:hypothetical protein
MMLEEYDEEIDDPLSEITYKEGELPELTDLTDLEAAEYQAQQVYNYSTDVEFQANITDTRRRYD